MDGGCKKSPDKWRRSSGKCAVPESRASLQVTYLGVILFYLFFFCGGGVRDSWFWKISRSSDCGPLERFWSQPVWKAFWRGFWALLFLEPFGKNPTHNLPIYFEIFTRGCWISSGESGFCISLRPRAWWKITIVGFLDFYEIFSLWTACGNPLLFFTEHLQFFWIMSNYYLSRNSVSSSFAYWR